MATDRTIGTRIRKRRQVLGMTQDDLAAQLHVSRSTVANWESGKHFPLRYLGAVEHVLGIDLSDGSAPPLSPRAQRMLDELTPQELAQLVEYVTGQSQPADEVAQKRGAR